jgi:hypothetical protein
MSDAAIGRPNEKFFYFEIILTLHSRYPTQALVLLVYEL